MFKLKNILALLAVVLCFAACSSKPSNARKGGKAKTSQTKKMSQTANDQSAKVLIKTTEGDITVLLYGDTPLHRDNFLKLVKNKTLEGTLFHRVINEFMVQAGDPDSKTAKSGQQLGAGDVGYTVPAEFKYPTHFHKRGALSAARQGDQVNPKKESSGCQFYIVTGKKASAAELDQMSARAKQEAVQSIFYRLAEPRMAEVRAMQQAGDQAGLMKLQQELVAQAEAEAAKGDYGIPQNIRDVYMQLGGTPFLDRNYTVFGEVLKGMDVVEKIEKAETDHNDRPKKDIRILSMEVIK